MLKYIIAAIITLILAVVLLYLAYIRIRFTLRQYQRMKAGKRTKFCLSATLSVILLASFFCSTVGVAMDFHRVLELSKASSHVVEQDDSGPEAPPDLSEVPIADPVSSVKELFPDYFYLSQVQDSSMLSLFHVITDGEVSAAALEPARQQLLLYLEQCAYPTSFFDFYAGLDQLFPAGKLVYEFEDVQNLEQCESQIRGIGEMLEIHLGGNDPVLIANDCNHLAIRAKDALYYGEPSGIQNKMLWVFAEIAFASLINEYIYSELTGSDWSDWCYRLAQVYDYMGGIADTPELKLQMYFLSAVCYHCAYTEVCRRDYMLAEGTYGCEILDAYFEMLYRVALRVEAETREDIFLYIWETSHSPELPEDIKNSIQNRLDWYDLYQDWSIVYAK